MNARKTMIGVMGAGERASSAECNDACLLGRLIAQQGWVLVTGGRNVGVMQAANRGAKEAGGLTVGILPSADFDGLSEYVDIPIVTGMGNARNNVNVLTSRVVIACGMGAGTASEVALALKNQTPVVLLHWSEAGCTFFQSLSGNRIQVANSPQQAIQLVLNQLEI
jgi:uncharacterized protein (TIGR00725 family)